MEQELSLDQVLDGESVSDTTEEAAEDAVETVEEEAPETTGETDDSPPESEEQVEQPRVPVAALTEERQKRQAAQGELDDLRIKLANQNSPAQPERAQAEEIDFLTDPDGWRDQLLGQVSTVINTVRNESRQQFLGMAEARAREVHDDYDGNVAYFVQAVQANPQLGTEANSAADPAEFAYQTGEKLKRLSEGGGDLNSLIQREREAAVREFQENNPSEADVPLDVPTSLSRVTAAKGSNVKDPGDSSFEQLFD
tara:strand:+ start:3673 stop:4434 length:762 start_codon:yes stop_codon:yes gene_type:complete